MSELESGASILQGLGLMGNGTAMTVQDMVQYRVEAFNSSIGELDKADGYDCPKCKNRGVVAVLTARTSYQQAGQAMEIVQCSCQKIRAGIMRMKKSGLEHLLKRYRLENFQTNEPWQGAIKDKAQRFIENPVGLFFIGGQSGCGKTFICTAIARHLLYAGLELRYEMWRDKSVYLKGLIGRPDDYAAAVNELKAVDVLYIDDFLKVPIGVDASKPTSADISLALELVNYRYNAGKTTILSSEWTVNEIAGFDEALGGRIFEMAGEFVLNIKKDRSRNQRLKNMMEI